MNTFVIVSFLEPFQDSFTKSQWPLHLTIVRPFQTEKTNEELVQVFKAFCSEAHKITTAGKSEEMFGVNHDIPVTELEDTDDLLSFQKAIIDRFSSWIQFHGQHFGNYRPHVTKRDNAEIRVGQEVIISSLSLIQSEGEQRQVICTCGLS